MGNAGDLNKLLELEWEAANITSTDLQNILFALADGKQGKSIIIMAEFFNISYETIRDNLKDLKFITVDNNNIATCISEPFRLLILDKLKHLRKDDGIGTTCGTLSYALAQQSGTASTSFTISFALTSGTTITFSGPLSPTVKPYVMIDGGGSGQPYYPTFWWSRSGTER